MTVFNNLEIGKTGLSAAQLGQTTTGHNIANANDENFSRQRVDQSADSNLHNGRPQGVRINGISRLHDKFNSEKLVSENSNLADWEARLKYMQNIESIFQDAEGKGVSEALTNFWNAWASVADQPESFAARQNLVVSSRQLTDQIVGLDRKLADLQGALTQDMLNEMQDINSLTKEVADLNKQIHRIESLKGDANDLKDKRDELIRQISTKTNINWFYNKQNMIDVQLAEGVPLVRGVSNYEVTAYYDTLDPALPEVGYALNVDNLLNVTKQLNAGSLKGIVEVRDQFINQQREKLSQLATALTDNVNQLHSAGTGITEPSSTLLSSISLNEPELNLPLTKLKDGTFGIQLVPHSSLEKSVEIMIEVDAGVDDIFSIIEKIKTASQKEAEKIYKAKTSNGIDQLVNQNTDPASNPDQEAVVIPPLIEAGLNQDKKLVLKAAQGYSLIFDNDASGFLGRIGMNSFFIQGKNLADFKINPELPLNPNKIALGYNQNPGDNTIALAVHDLQFDKILQDNSNTFEEFYNNMYAAVGASTKKAMQQKDNHQNIYDQYLAIRNSVTGVNIDEEMAQMIKYQKAYDASAKYISTIDQMAETLINM